MKKLIVLSVLALLLLGGRAQASLEGFNYVNSYSTQLTETAGQILASYPMPSEEAAQAMEQVAFQGDQLLVMAIQNGWLDFTSPKEQCLFMGCRLEMNGYWAYAFYYQTGDTHWLPIGATLSEAALGFFKLTKLLLQQGQ